MTARGVDPSNLTTSGKNASPMTRLDFADLCYDAKHVISI
jgi:hypothetical protein